MRRTELLDTPAEEPFDQLARLAARLLEAPLAFVTVVDDTRSFWKSAIGVEATEVAERQNPVEQSFCQYVVGSGHELLVEDATTDPRTRENPSVELMNVKAWAGFPVRSESGEVLGSFCVVDREPRRWTERDIEILRVLSLSVASEIRLRTALAAERAALAAERAAHQQADEIGAQNLALAQTLQESLLPRQLPNLPGIELAARYLPAQRGRTVGGDFYDVFKGQRDSWFILIGDVCGKGPEAARRTALARYTARVAATTHSGPAAILDSIENALIQDSSESGEILVSAACLLVAHQGPVKASCAIAGHPPPFVVRDRGVEPVHASGPLLGAGLSAPRRINSFNLWPGESVFLYTDGMTDARDEHGGFYGEERLRKVLGARDVGAEQLAASAEESVTAFAGASTSDDIAFVIVRGLAAGSA